MSRTNHYRLCDRCTEDFICWLHERPWSSYNHKPIRHIEGRRPWDRKALYTTGPKRWHNAPPRWWWQEKHAKYRRICSRMIQRHEDPLLPKERKIIDLWGWY